MISSNEELKAEAREFYDQGMSAKEIHEAINKERSIGTIYNWVKSFEDEPQEEPEKVEPDISLSTDEPQTGIIEPSSTTTEASKKLSKPQTTPVEPPTLEEIKLLELELHQSNAVIEVKRKKRHAVREFNGLIGSLLVFSQKKSWDDTKANEYLQTLRDVQDVVEGVCEYEPEQYEKNIYWIEATNLISKLEKTRRNPKRKKEMSKIGLLSLEEVFRFEEIMELSKFEETEETRILIGFTAKYGALMINGILANDDKDLNMDELKGLIGDTQHVLAYANENDLLGQFTEQVGILETLKAQFEELYSEAEAAWIFKSEVFEMDEGLKSAIQADLDLFRFTRDIENDDEKNQE